MMKQETLVSRSMVFVAMVACVSYCVPVADAALMDGLISYWTFDDGSGTVLSDSIGTNDGTLAGSPTPLPTWITDGRFDGALRFAPNEVAMTLPGPPAFNLPGDEVSISAWVRLDTLPSGLPPANPASNFAGAGIFDSLNDAYVLYLDRDNAELRFKVTNTSNVAARPGIPEGSLSTGTWLHVVGVYDGVDARIYLAGTVASTPLSLTGDVRTNQLPSFGNQDDGAGAPDGPYPYGGDIDDVAIWSRALTSDEVSALSQNSLETLLSIPEPTALALAVLGLPTLLIRPRRDRRQLFIR